MSDPVLEELPGDRLRVTVDGREFVVDAACPHRKGRLVHGYVNERTLRITCPLHRTAFDLATGAPVAGPATGRLAVHADTRAAAAPAVRPYRPEQVWLPASERLTEWGPEFHAEMLGDTLRMRAYRAAIAETVRPGMTVLDLGTGTGILARWALDAGADVVFGIDLNTAVLADATERLAAAGYGDRWRPIAGLSFDVSLPHRVDVVISEIMGNLADNEGMVAILADARRRFLAEGGVLLPRRVDSYLVPVHAEEAHAGVATGVPADADSAGDVAAWLRSRGARDPFDLYYDAIIPVGSYLAAPRLVRTFDLAGGSDRAAYDVDLVYPVHRDGLLTGFKGYFIADLSPTVTLDISGDDIAGGTTSNSWKHCYLPIAAPVPVRRGDRVALTFSRSTVDGRGFGQRYAWRGRVIRDDASTTEFAQSTDGRA